jgi:RNA polymerase sigma-70 factor (ECF subfamily)
MDPPPARSGYVSQTLVAPARDVPSDADVAFEELYRSSRDDVFAYTAGLLRDRAAAEEVTAAAFERAFRRRRSYDARRGTPRAWLFGIARNAALDELRRRSRLAEMPAEPSSPSIDLDELADRGLKRGIVRAAFERLSPRDRELVSLKFFAGLSNREISRVLGTSESNAGTKLHRAITKLREACHETA